jgi:hypothetical protein
MRWLCCCLLTVAMTGTGRPQPAIDKTPTADPAADLKAGNAVARAAYQVARDRVRAAAEPVVLWDGEDLIFRYGTYRRVSRPTPAAYHDLKVAGHMVLGLDALLSRPDGELSAVQLFELRRYRESLRKVRRALAQRGLSKPQLERQQTLLDSCDEFLGKAIEARKTQADDLRGHLRRLRPLLDENSRDAARLQIDGLQGEMQRYRGELSADEWQKLRVVVQGSQPPRKDNLAVQYFARLLGEPGEGLRIVYAEAIFDEQKALTLLANKLFDTRVGQDVWDDPGHLHRDLLGDAARAYLDELFEKK